MTDQEHDVEDLIAALRDDLPSRDDERRVRARLVTAGVMGGFDPRIFRDSLRNS